MIYAASQEGVPTVFLQWHQGAIGGGAQIILLHSVSNYVPRMGLTESPCDDGSFASKRDIACRNSACINWLPASLHQTGSTVYFPKDLAIDTTMVADPDADLLGPFKSTDANVEPLCIRKTICLPAPFIEIFLKWDLTPVEAWTRIRGAIIDGGLEVDCCTIINWIRFALTLKTGDNKNPLAMLPPNTPLEYGDLLWHWHHMITRHLPGMEPALRRVQGLLIATNIGNFAVGMVRDREAKLLTCQAYSEKGVPDHLGSNLTLPTTPEPCRRS